MDIKPDEIIVCILASDIEGIITSLEEMKNKTFFREILKDIKHLIYFKSINFLFLMFSFFRLLVN